jgi:hypothetical protein
MDPLNDLPPASRVEVVGAVRAAFGVTEDEAERILRASEPFWEVLEDLGQVDGWGGGEFCHLLPQVCLLIRSVAHPAGPS